MKIVHVVYSLEMGGAEVLVAQLCRIQRANGHDVSLCAYSKLGPIGEVLAAEGFSIYVPGEAHPARTMLRYLRHFRSLRPDIVHCHNPAPTLQAALPARLACARCVLATRHSLVAPPYDRAAEIKFSLMARACHYVVGICEVTCQNLRGAPLADPSKIKRVYNGVSEIIRQDPSPIEPDIQPNSAPHDFTLLFVGRLAEVKDLGTLIRAFAIASAEIPQLRLWIVGEGPVRTSLEALTAELNLTNHIRFWGQRLDTAAFFSTADCFVMSSVSEGLPMSLLQAMSIGLPAITTDVGGMAEVLRLSQSGLLAPVGDAPAYAQQILTLVGNPTLGAQLSANARAAYHRHFTIEQMDAAYMALYQCRSLPDAPPDA
jgi:glycosyltransferase involved in cell wall biosynthesis